MGVARLGAGTDLERNGGITTARGNPVTLILNDPYPTPMAEDRVEQLVGRERRGRVSQLDSSGDA